MTRLVATNAEQVFLDNLQVIDEVVAFVAFRHRLTPEERDELSAGVRLKIIDDNYAVLRKFSGRSSLKTYLTAVVHRYFLDRRIERWGKWRPSMEARRLGPVAILLDRLVSRDGLTFDEAVETLRTNHGVAETREALQQIHDALPRRTRRHFVGDEQLADLPADGRTEDRLIHDMDRDAGRSAVEQALQAALASCAPEDRLLLKLRFQDSLPVARIARLLAAEQKPLYRRIDRIVAMLRLELERRGVDEASAATFLEDSSEKAASSSVPLRGGWSRAPRGRMADHV